MSERGSAGTNGASHRPGRARDEAVTPSPAGAHGRGNGRPGGGAPGAGLSAVAGLRRGILVSLRRDGPGTPDALASRLGASRTGVLQQLRALEAAGLVRREAERHGVGRPRHVYDVTSAAQELFPANYDAYAAGLLAAVEAVGGGELVDDVLAVRRGRLAETITARLSERLTSGASLIERVHELARFQDENGYLAEAVLTVDGRIRLQEHNCAIYRIAAVQPGACRAELDLFRQVLGADVVRETHIASGDRCCSYRIGDKRQD